MTPAELTAARKAANLRQVDLARLANIRREDLNHMEAGRRTIGPGMTARLLLALAEHKLQQARERAEPQACEPPNVAPPWRTTTSPAAAGEGRQMIDKMTLAVPDDAARAYVRANYANCGVDAYVDPNAEMGTFAEGARPFRYGMALDHYDELGAAANAALQDLWNMGYWNTPEANCNN